MSANRGVLRRNRHEVYGLGAVLVLVLVAVLVVAGYLHVFTPSVSATVRTDRAGLLVLPEADVAMNDVRVGRISAVRYDAASDGALIDVEIDPEMADVIPAGVTAQLISPTVFGPKYVDLVAPASPSGGSPGITAGSVIEAARVQTEANTAFEILITVLRTVEPSKINTGLGALSIALNGRGDRLGQALSDLNTYLERINPSIPTLQRDIEMLGPVLDAYADASPDLIALIDDLTTTSATLVEEQAGVDAVLSSFGAFADDIDLVLRENGPGLANTLDVLNPTTALLARYAPVLPCTFESLNVLRKVTEPAFGGAQPGLRSHTTFQPGEDPYVIEENLPTLGVDEPGCYGGVPEPGEIPEHVRFDDGSPALDVRDRPLTAGDTPLAVLLFGDELGPTVQERIEQAGGPR